MFIRVLVNGAAGRMGRITVNAVQQENTLKLVGETRRSDDLCKAIRISNADVVVDFTDAASVFENTKKIIAANAHPIIGTSGLLSEQIKELQQLCHEKQHGGIIAPNFCIAALLMMRFSEQAARYFPNVEIIEIHHEGKRDAPSGTAIKTAELIANARKITPTLKKIHETLLGSRGAYKDQVSIHALRLPGFLAQQEVIFGHLGGNLRITHETIDRHAFMPGVILACQQVVALKELIYGLDNLLV